MTATIALEDSNTESSSFPMSVEPIGVGPPVGRDQVTTALKEFVFNRWSLADLRRYFTPLLVDEKTEAQKEDRELVFRLIFLFEDDSIGEEAHRGNARRVIEAMRSIPSNDVLIEMVPIITDQVRLCKIIEKYKHRVISRTGLLSSISEARYTRRFKDWLIAADLADLDDLCAALTATDYARVGVMSGML